MDWKPLGARRTSGSVSTNELPGQRGVRLIHIPDIVPNRYVHFSWKGDSFCIRDYTGGREMRQTPGTTALDIWKMHKGPIFSHQHTSEDVEFWEQKLREITEETAVGAGEGDLV